MNLANMGWRSRGYIPHLNSSGELQSITFRLYDALPRSVAAAIDAKVMALPKPQRVSAAHDDVERWLDAGYGSCMLRDPAVATVVESAVLYFHPVRYRLEEWCIMPNHLHMLIYVEHPFSLSQIMQSLKSFSAKEANRVLGRHGPFWFPEYFDRYIRTQRHFETVGHYIRQNLIAAGLCASAEQWRFSSAWAGRTLLEQSAAD